MKRKDLALVVVIVFVSAIASFFISKAIFGTPQKNQVQVEVVQAIVSSFPEADKAYFNDKAFDPTQTITIGQNANTEPFNKGSH